MGLFNKRYGGYGREDKPPFIQTLLKGDSLIIRIGAFVICALIYYAVVSLTHKETTDPVKKTDSVQVTKKTK
ncbi:MAG TPA: hypothetical protein VIX80_04340 [Candidatus Kapabacteria bacterium]